MRTGAQIRPCLICQRFHPDYWLLLLAEGFKVVQGCNDTSQCADRTYTNTPHFTNLDMAEHVVRVHYLQLVALGVCKKQVITR